MPHPAHVLWVKHGHLFHAVEEREHSAICGRDVPVPRVKYTGFMPPDEDVRCAKCDKILWPRGDDTVLPGAGVIVPSEGVT